MIHKHFITGPLGVRRATHVSRHGFLCAGCRIVFPVGTVYVTERKETTGKRFMLNADCWARGERIE